MELGFVEILKILFFGIVEGVTEWLPISSTGHMLLVDAFLPLQMSAAFKEMFFVVIQLGAILAVVVIFWKKMWPFRFGEKQVLQKDIFFLWFRVVVACIPSGVLGILFDDFLEANFGSAFTIALMLVLYGVLFIVIEIWNRKRRPRTTRLEDIGYPLAFAIGIFQVLSLIPGTSRSGATIVGALLLGVSRTAAAEFTFFLAVPTMLGASLVKLLKFGFSFTSSELIALLLGSAVAFAVSLVAIRFLMNYVKQHDFKVFGWYRIVLGGLILLLLVL